MEASESGASMDIADPSAVSAAAPAASVEIRQDTAQPNAPAAPASKPVKELKVEDALHYLDQVKMEFSDKPQIYNEFLEIMKNFKAQTINTPGVIERVKNLFRGYNKLILGFNTFLPDGDGYKIELTAEEEQAGNSFAAQNAGSQPAGSQPAAAEAPGTVMTPTGGVPAGGGAPPGTADSKPPQQVQQQHAISYVTTIRNRFQNEPDTYRAFLKILHTYQKEQKGIKDVLEQVSLLFADHPDLLMEFTYFLPDAVQGQAKERLNRAARESEMRRRMLQVQQQNQAAAMMSQTGHKRNAAGNRKQAQQYQREMMMQQHAMQAQVMQQQRKQQRRRHGDIDGRSSSHISQTAERRFFDNVKDILTSTTRDGWVDFVKQLDLFVNDITTKKDFLMFAQDILGAQAQDQFSELKRLINARADYDSHSSDTYYAIPTSEIDFNQCRKCTPSYRALPKDYPRPCCTERSPLEQEVLNDDWITFPYGHDGDNTAYTFKHMMKNSYEEELFKCEEDRFEIDMVIDSNYCTIRILEPIAEEIAAMKIVEDSGEGTGSHAPRFSLQLEKRNLSVIHMNAISRLYGEHGSELLDLLHKNPAGTVPIVLKRLRQKDREWRKAREDLNVKWKDAIERNYEKSFDHRSYYFKRQDKRFYDAKQLIADIKESDKFNEKVTGGSKDDFSSDKDAVSADPKVKAEVDAMNEATTYTNSFGKEGATTVGAMLASSTTVDIAEIDLTALTRVFPSPEVMSGGLFKTTCHQAGLASGGVNGADSCLYPTAATTIMSTINGAPLGGRNNRGVPLNLLKGIKPQLNMRFPSKHHGIHKDIYGIFCHFAEAQKLQSADQERVSSIWRDLLRTFFNLPVHYLYGDLSSTAATVLEHAKGTSAHNAAASAAAAATKEALGEKGEHGMDVMEESRDASVSNTAGVTAASIDSIPVDVSEAWAAGTRVITAYGCGVVLAYRQHDSIYCIGLPFGKAFVKPSNIIGAEQLSPSAMVALGVAEIDAKGKKGEKDNLVHGQNLPTSQTYAGDPTASIPAGAAPVGVAAGGSSRRGAAPSVPVSYTFNEAMSEPCKLLLSTPAGYLFLRMYHTIFTRLAAAKDLSDMIKEKRTGVVTSGLGSGTGTMTEGFDQPSQEPKTRENMAFTMDVDVPAPAPAPAPKTKRGKGSIMQTSKQSKPVGAAAGAARISATPKAGFGGPSPGPTGLSARISATPKAGFGGPPPGPTGLSKHPLAYLDAADEEALLVAGKGSPGPAYSAFYGQLLALLDGTIDQYKYEESCRLLLGNRSYVVHTLDKVISQCFKVLQQMSNDEIFNKLVGLFVYHRSTSPHFKITTALCGSGANYRHAAAVAAGMQAQTGVIAGTGTTAAVSSGGRKSKTTQNAAPVPGTGHSTAIHNLEAWYAGTYGRTAGMDPVPYLIHTAKVLSSSGSDDELYRVQASTDPAIGTLAGHGETVVSVQYLGSMTDANLLAACAGCATTAPGVQKDFVGQAAVES